VLYNLNVCNSYITPLVVYNTSSQSYDRLHNMLHNTMGKMCLSIISTVIIGWLTLLPAPLQRRRRCCPSSSIPRSSLAPLLSFCHSDMPWLAPPIPPHPEVELGQPTSVAPPHAGIGNSSIAVAKLMRQGGRAVSSHKALHHWHTGTTKNVLSPAQIKARQVSAAGTVLSRTWALLLAS
jgi:hypothetical protein